MKKVIRAVAVVAMIMSGAAYADGFKCQTADGNFKIKIFNHTDSSVGTRNVAVMILSDARVNLGNKTIARFTDANETLTGHGPRYEANVDLRFNDSSRKGELIAGTKLGELDAIRVEVDFSYANPIDADDATSGTMTLIKRNGKEIEKALICFRYLKQGE